MNKKVSCKTQRARLTSALAFSAIFAAAALPAQRANAQDISFTDLMLTANATTQSVEPGGMAEIHYVITNKGLSGAVDVRLRAAGLNGMKTVGCANDPDAAADCWVASRLAPGESAEVIVLGQVPLDPVCPASGPCFVRVEAFASSFGGHEEHPEDNYAETWIRLCGPDELCANQR